MKRVLFILAFAICECAFAADVIERITVFRSDDLRGVTTEQYDNQSKAISSMAPIDAGRGDTPTATHSTPSHEHWPSY